MTSDVTADRDVLVNLDGGRCLEAREARPEDVAGASAVIRASEPTWQQVLAGRIDPILGLARRKLALDKGSLASLVPHARGARALLAAAARVGGDFPSDTTLQIPRVPGPKSKARRPGPGPVRRGPTGVEAGSPEPPAFRRTELRTTTAGLDTGLFVYRLWEKAKRLGVWNPADLDFEQDREDWTALDELEREVLLHLAALFQAGEEAVTLDLLPLIQVVASEGRLEEEMYLTTFLFEEAKHVETFQRFFAEVAPDHGDLRRFETPSYRAVFHEALPSALRRLRDDRSPVAQAQASATYNLIVEGVLAETGYHAYHEILDRQGILPGMREAARLLKQDESRHLAYGIHLLSRLVAAHGDEVWDAVEDQMSSLFDPAMAIVEEVFEAYETMPFGLELEHFTGFALSQFQKRLERLDEARGATLEEIIYGRET